MNSTTLLHRQAHPSFMAEGQPTSQVFIPFPKDNGHLSVYDGDQVSAAEAHRHYTQTLGFGSHSVWSVTKGEADAENVPASPDPLPDFAAHGKIDFSGKTDKESRKIAKRLKEIAKARGPQFST